VLLATELCISHCMVQQSLLSLLLTVD